MRSNASNVSSASRPPTLDANVTTPHEESSDGEGELNELREQLRGRDAGALRRLLLEIADRDADARRRIRLGLLGEDGEPEIDLEAFRDRAESIARFRDTG